MPAVSNSEVDASQASSDVNAKVDINTLENLDAAVFNEGRSWAFNIKKLADDTQTFDQSTRTIYRDLEVERARSNNRFNDLLSHETLYALAEQRGSRARDVYHSEDRFWNLDEQTISRTQVDAMTSAVIFQMWSKVQANSTQG